MFILKFEFFILLYITIKIIVLKFILYRFQNNKYINICIIIINLK